MIISYKTYNTVIKKPTSGQKVHTVVKNLLDHSHEDPLSLANIVHFLFIFIDLTSYIINLHISEYTKKS